MYPNRTTTIGKSCRAWCVWSPCGCTAWCFQRFLLCGQATSILSRYTTRKRVLKSHRLSETPIVWKNTSDTFTLRGLGYNRASCKLVKCFELKESDGELRRSCLHRQPACLQPCARLIILVSEEDLRGNTVKLVVWEVRVIAFAQTWAAHYRVERRIQRLLYIFVAGGCSATTSSGNRKQYEGRAHAEWIPESFHDWFIPRGGKKNSTHL